MSPSVRIAMIGHKHAPSREGGVEVVVSELAYRMVERGHDVTLYSRDDWDDAPEYAAHGPYEWRGAHVVPVTTVHARGLSALSASFFGTIRALRQRSDVIHYHAEGPCVPLVLAHLAGIRTVATIHGLDWQRAKWGRLASTYIRLGERMAARFADEVIVLSRNMQRYFQDTYGRRTRYIPNGFEPRAALPARTITDLWGLSAGSYLLFVGRIVPEKGLHYLIEAFRGLETDKSLVIAGKADSEEYYEEVKALAKGDERVRFLGFVQGDALGELYSNAFAYVLPSDVEGMPLTLLEALSYGCSCVTSDIPELTEVLDGRGETFEHGSVDSLRAALERILDEKDGAVADRPEPRRPDWDEVVDETLAVYEGDGR